MSREPRHDPTLAMLLGLPLWARRRALRSLAELLAEDCPRETAVALAVPAVLAALEELAESN
jgi:hypothetical protein